jgi:hypothetical protein
MILKNNYWAQEVKCIEMPRVEHLENYSVILTIPCESLCIFLCIFYFEEFWLKWLAVPSADYYNHIISFSDSE